MTTSSLVTEMLSGSGFTDDPYPLFAEWRRETPVREGDVMVELGAPTLTPPGRPTFSLLRYDDVVGAFKDGETFSTKIYTELFAKSALGEGSGGFFGAEGEEHRFWRGLFIGLFARKALLQWDEDVMRPAARRCVEEFAAGTKSGDLIGYAVQFPVRMIYGLIGIDDENADEYDRFQELALALLLGIAVQPDRELMKRNAERAAEAGRDLLEIVLPIVERKRAAGASGNDLISHMIRVEFEGRGLDDRQIAVFVRNSLPAATENVWRQFLNTMTCLLTRPELLEAIRADLALLPKALTEGERYEAPVLAQPRLTLREVELHGVAIPAGAAIVLAAGAANRDPDTYPDPDTFDLHRTGPTPLAFGYGAHICPGLNVARFEIIAAIDALLDLLPNLRLNPEAETPRIVGAPFRGPSSLEVIWD
jgi:cytochrome P450